MGKLPSLRVDLVIVKSWPPLDVLKVCFRMVRPLKPYPRNALRDGFVSASSKTIKRLGKTLPLSAMNKNSETELATMFAWSRVKDICITSAG